VEEGHEAGADDGADAAHRVDEREGRGQDEKVRHDLHQLRVRERHPSGQQVLDAAVARAQLRQRLLQSDLQHARRAARVGTAQPAIAQRRVEERRDPLEHLVRVRARVRVRVRARARARVRVRVRVRVEEGCDPLMSTAWCPMPVCSRALYSAWVMAPRRTSSPMPRGVRSTAKREVSEA